MSVWYGCKGLYQSDITVSLIQYKSLLLSVPISKHSAPAQGLQDPPLLLWGMRLTVVSDLPGLVASIPPREGSQGQSPQGS